MNPVHHTMGMYKKQSHRPHYDQNTGEVDFKELDPGGMKKVYYAKSAHSHNDSIKFVITFIHKIPSRVQELIQETNSLMNNLLFGNGMISYLFHTKPGVKAYEDHYQSKGKTDHNLQFEPT